MSVIGYIDVHSHILFGLDDGSRNMEQSIHMLEIAHKEGIEAIIATPHNMPGKGCPESEVIRNKIKLLQEVAERLNIPVQIYLGTEYYYREEVQHLFEEEKAITLGNSEYVLVEFNPLEEKVYIQNAVRAICNTGYRPVIAHAERYLHLMKDAELIYDFQKMGALIQVNAASVTGDNGRQTKAYVKHLLKRHLVDLIGTDAHSDGRRGPYLLKCAEYLYKRYPADYVDMLLFAGAKQWIS